LVTLMAWLLVFTIWDKSWSTWRHDCCYSQYDTHYDYLDGMIAGFHRAARHNEVGITYSFHLQEITWFWRLI
jgi:hypothetical protein